MNYNGIDIYNEQGRPDFTKVKGAGINFVILKATEGVDYVDPSFTANAQAAESAGLLTGAYHFLRSTPIDQQAQDFLAAVGPYNPCLLAIDVEEPKSGSTEIRDLGKSGITSRILTINTAARNAGYTCPIYVYASKSWFGDMIDTDACRQAGMKIWMASYSNDTPENTDHSDICDMWQWCSDGSVDGISGNVCRDVSYGAVTDNTCAPLINAAWHNENAGYWDAYVSRIGNMCFVFGNITGPALSAGTVLMKIPEGFRPSKRVSINTYYYNPNINLRLDITTSGELVMMSTVTFSGWLGLNLFYKL